MKNKAKIREDIQEGTFMIFREELPKDKNWASHTKKVIVELYYHQN